MKNSFYILCIWLCITPILQAQTKAPLQLEGTVSNLQEGIIYLQRYDNKVFKVVDSARVAQGHFAFNTSVILPELYGLSLDPSRTELQLFLDNAPITVVADDPNNLRQASVSGSTSDAQFRAYHHTANGQMTAAEMIQQDPKSIVAAFLLFRNYSYDLSPVEIREHIALLDPALGSSQYVRILNDLAAKQEAVLPGNKAIDFISKDQDGNTVRFFDHLGKGYVLLDFWAGWCPPCRAENPNLVRAYNAYKDRGFTIFGVSLDKTRASWLKAISDDDLQWTQVSDLAFWDTEAPALYGVRFIPSNVLIDKDGIIVARNISGDDLHELLEKLL